jgi:hypothetical protein
MGIQGVPIPYGAPNASPHVERLNAQHVVRVCREYTEYYNRARPSQALHAIPDPYPELTKPPLDQGQLLALPVLGG